MRSGYIGNGPGIDGDNLLHATGNYGGAWSSYAERRTAFSHSINVSIDKTYPLISSYRWGGFSLRCLSTVLDR